MERDSVKNTFFVATTLCVVCSVLVSAAAVSLRHLQEANKIREKKKNVLIAAGLYVPDQSIEKTYDAQIESIVIDLKTGQVDTSIDPSKIDQLKAARDPDRSDAIPSAQDIASIKRQERHALVYRVEKNGKADQYVLPIRGVGLWSTLYGFVSLDADMTTIRGLTFYQHGETPGLGGEVDNVKWKAKWVGKLAFDEDDKIRIHVIKGSVDLDQPAAKHQVDGLSGATITSRGVTNMLQFWLGDDGFGPFLNRQRKERGEADG